MNLLVMDTSTERAALAVATATGGVYEAATEAARRHGRDLIPRLEGLLGEAGLTAGELDVVGVGLGPGSYTGLRVGVTAAKTLAFVTGADLVGLDSLLAVGRNAPAEAEKVDVVADAQRGELYVAELRRLAAGALLEPVGEIRIVPLLTWLDRLDPGVLVLGPGLDSPRIRAAMPARLLSTPASLHYPRGRRLLELAREAWAGGQRENPWVLEPRYLRRSAAEDQFLKSLSP